MRKGKYVPADLMKAPSPPHFACTAKAPVLQSTASQADVALSRVGTLAQLRSIGLTAKVRDIIEMGPHEGIPAAFKELFGDLEVTTKAAAMEALARLGWR